MQLERTHLRYHSSTNRYRLVEVIESLQMGTGKVLRKRSRGEQCRTMAIDTTLAGIPVENLPAILVISPAMENCSGQTWCRVSDTTQALLRTGSPEPRTR